MGRTAPNPPVACVVIDRSGRELRLFVGFTEPAGQRHAEIVALDAAVAGRAVQAWDSERDARGRILFVTLEPCSRHGRTPPCTDRILSDGTVNRVVIGVADPTLNLEGTDILRKHGIAVRGSPTLRALAAAFLEGFLRRSSGDGPRLHLKAAVDSAGRMGGPPATGRLRISGPEGLAFGMLLRAKLDAVVVGPGTVAVDRPALDLRVPEEVYLQEWTRESGSDLLCDLWFSHRFEALELARTQQAYQPLRVFLLDRPFERQPEFLQRQADLETRTGRKSVFVALEGSDFERRGAPLGQPPRRLPSLADRTFPAELRRLLSDLGCNEVLVEGGARLHAALGSDLRPGDRVWTLRGPTTTTEARSEAPFVRVPDFFSKGEPEASYRLGRDRLEVRVRT